MRTKTTAVAAVFLALAVLPGAWVPCTSAGGEQFLPNNREVKHVIMMVADGMGLANVTAARIRKNGIGGPPLRFETLDEVGYQRTYSETNTVTDSAAAGSAWACGDKFANDEICLHGDGRPHNPSLLELAKAQGWATGLVTTQTVTNATPAVFGAHATRKLIPTDGRGAVGPEVCTDPRRLCLGLQGLLSLRTASCWFSQTGVAPGQTRWFVGW